MQHNKKRWDDGLVAMTIWVDPGFRNSVRERVAQERNSNGKSNQGSFIEAASLKGDFKLRRLVALYKRRPQ